MLTQQQVQQARQQLNLTNPNTQPTSTDWSSPDAFGTSPQQQTTAPVPKPGDTGTMGEHGSIAGGLVGSVAQDWINIFNSVVDNYSSLASELTNLKTTPKKAITTSLNVPGQVAGGILDLFGEGGKSILKIITDRMPAPLKESIKQGFQQTLQDPVVKQGLELAHQGGDLYNQWKEKNPMDAQNLENIINIGSVLAGQEPAAKTAQGAADFTAGAVEKGVGVIKGVGEKVTGLGEKAGELKTGIGNILKGKTEQEILATAPEEVYKLKPQERSIWINNEKTKIGTESSATQLKINQELDAKLTNYQKQADDLERQLATASRDKVIELRPKIKQAMAEQSAEYRTLIEKGMKGKENIPITIGDLKGYIDIKYADNPGIGAAIKEKLGLDTLLEPNKKAPFKTSLGELYNQTKSLKQDISAGARGGTKVFTSEDKLTDDAINTLTGFMKKQGVDFSEANRFWAEYAPIRNQLVKEAKPFVQADIQTKTFANTLMRVAKGKDVNNENFINEVEDLLGKPINDENKAIISKIDANTKQKIASEMEAQQKTLENQLTKEQKLGNLKSAQIEITRKARTRDIFKNIFTRWIPGLVGADWIVKRLTGIGI
jgi:hypothetical protein